jgi:hypothetical protein
MFVLSRWAIGHFPLSHGKSLRQGAKPAHGTLVLFAGWTGEMRTLSAFYEASVITRVGL